MENIRRARCSRVVLSELLAARKAIFFISARARMKNRSARMRANARKDHSSHLFSEICPGSILLAIAKVTRTFVAS